MYTATMQYWFIW